MQPEAPPHTIHPLDAGHDATAFVARLTGRDRERTAPGVHVVVHVTSDGNVGYARIDDPSCDGNGSQRQLRHARRGASSGTWSELHHPRSEQHVGAWKERAAEPLDRFLIVQCKRAWALEGDAPYVVEFAPVPLEDCAIPVA